MIPSPTPQQLLQGELADLALYTALRRKADGDLATLLDHFIATEERHAAFWRERFSLTALQPDIWGRLRNTLIRIAAGLGGPGVTALALEAVEVNGIAHYLTLWEHTTDPSIREGLRDILTDELQHEDEAVTAQSGRSVSPENIRNAFLGFNDGSVEILGAVSGLAAALANPQLVAISGVTVAVAGSISMAAGAYMSTHGEAEMRATAARKDAFLNNRIVTTSETLPLPWKAARTVGIAYFVGAAVPVLPFLLGAHTPWWSIVLSGALILLVSAILAFLSGMHIRRRLAMNLGIILVAVLASSLVGALAEGLVR